MKTILRAVSCSLALARVLAASGTRGPLVKPSQVPPAEPVAMPADAMPTEAAPAEPSPAGQAAPVEEGTPDAPPATDDSDG